MKRLALALCLAGACERSQPPEPKPVERPAPPPHVLRVLRAQGTDLAADAPLPEGPIVLAPGAAVTVAIDDGVRVELRGPGRFALTGEQLLASEGLLSVDVAAQPVRAGKRAFSVATPAGQLEVPFAARFVLYAPAQKPAELALVSGEALADGALPVGANRRVCFAALGPHASSLPGFSTVEAALAALPTSSACDGQPPELAKLDKELAQQLELFTRNQAEQQALIASARAHPSANLVQDLASRGQLTLAARTRALTLRAQLAAAQLGAAHDPARTPLLTRAAELESPAR